MGKIDKIIEGYACKSPNSKEEQEGYLNETITELKSLILGALPEKYGSIKYPKGSDGEKLMLLNRGFNHAIDECRTNLEKLFESED